MGAGFAVVWAEIKGLNRRFDEQGKRKGRHEGNQGRQQGPEWETGSIDRKPADMTARQS